MIRKKTILGAVAVITSATLLAGCSGNEITVSTKRVELALDEQFSNAYGFAIQSECAELITARIGETFECVGYEPLDENRRYPKFAEVRIEESGYSWRLIEEEGDWETLILPTN